MLNAIVGFGKMGITELLVVLVIVLVIFGPKQLPKLAKTFGKTINSFKKGVTEGLDDDDDDEPKKAANTAEAKTEDAEKKAEDTESKE